MPAFAGDEYIGLCATCIHAPTCVYRAKRGRDALYCEMFDSSPIDPADSDPANSATADKTTPEKDSNPHEPEKIKGLCINCAHRDTCRLPKPRGGVWHCEEYA